MAPMPKTLLLHQILKIRELTERSVISDGLSVSSLNQQDWVESKLFSTPMVWPACQHELVTPFSRASPHSLSHFLPSLSLSRKDEQGKNKREKGTRMKEKKGSREGSKGRKISIKSRARTSSSQSSSMVSSRALTSFFLKSSVKP